MSSIEKIKRVYRYFFKNNPKYKITINVKTERHGSVYGGWDIIKQSLTKNSIVYSVGIGEDISFDLSVIEKYGCVVHGFDPTPRVASWLSEQNLPNLFKFYPIGLSDFDGILTFYSPENEKHISHKIFPEQHSKPVEVPCNKIKSIMASLHHSHIDLLKIDIEGFEYAVLEDLLKEDIRPLQLLVEFHHFFPEIGNAKTEDAIRLLEQNGYRLFHVSDSFCEYSFKYQNLL